MALGFQALPLPVLTSPAIPAGTVIAVAPEGLIVGEAPWQDGFRPQPI